MKKLFLTMISMALMAMSANAQEVCTFNPNNELGLDTDYGTALAAGTVIGETASIVATIGADDFYKPQSLIFTVNGVSLAGGLQGWGSNPKDADGGIPATTLIAPVIGNFLEFEAKADGFLYLMINARSNKAYSVFEEGTAIGYTFAALGDASTDLGAVYQFILVGEGELNEIKNPIEWAEREYLKATAPEKYAAHLSTGAEGMETWDVIKVDGLGVIKFPVYKDCRYIVNGNGTKIIAAGYVFSTEDNVTISSADGVTIIGEGGNIPTFDVWNVAGDKALFGTDWDMSSNIMRTYNGEDYSLTKNNLTLPKGTYEYKVFKDHSTQESYPSSNAKLVIEENATYSITFTFNASTKELSATATKTDGLYYNFIEKGKVAEVIQNPNKYKGTVIIPSTVTHEGEEYTVTKIADNAFYDCGNLISVTIPNSLKSIGYNAFSYSKGLTTINIPNSVSSIGDDAFKGCSGLTSITIPNSITRIGELTFYGCSGLTSINIPNSITYIGKDAFSGCSKLNSITIPNSVTEIGNRIFSGCSSLTSVDIPNSVTSIGYNSFANCTGLTSVTIPNSVTYLSGFSGCTGLTSISIPSNVTTIGGSAFDGCTGLTSITIPSNVTSINGRAFQGCIGLTTAVIPNSVTRIDDYALADCSELKTMTIGNSVNYISTYAFANCSALTDVYCLAENVPYTSAIAFNESYPEFMTLHVPAASIEAYRSTEPWSQFKAIVAIEDGDNPEIKKCATPEISYENGRVKFTCETEDVEYISSVTLADEHNYFDDEIQLSQKYKITVYATKAGYENSDVATREIVIKGDNKAIVVGDVDGDGKVNVADHVKLSDIIMNK